MHEWQSLIPCRNGVSKRLSFLQGGIMKKEAVALCRVSTAEQRVDGNSLESQQKHVYDYAKEVLQCEIEKAWILDVSSRAGKNVKRKDLLEIREYCKRNKHIKYFIVDRVNRLMREVEYFYWFKTELKFLGVKLLFADPSQQELNGDSDIAMWKTFLEIFSAEKDNRERAQTTITRMKDRTLQGYYLFAPHQGYRKSETAGLRIPDIERFNLLQEALRNVASGRMNKHEALKVLSQNGYKTPSGKELRIDVFNKILVDDYYAGLISVAPWGEKFQKINGLHTPMITEEEHEAIKSYMGGKKTFHRKQHNPEFPMSNLLFCECGGKFVGLMQGNGKGKFYPRYRCRKCGKQLKRDIIHQGIERILGVIVIPEEFKAKIINSLEIVWREEQKNKLVFISNLDKRLRELQEKKNGLVVALSENPTLAEDIKQTIEKVKLEISDLESQVRTAKQIEEDLIEFTAFALNFIEMKSKEFFKIEFEEREKCKQLIFPEEIFITFSGKVCTPMISPLLSLMGMKKEPQKSSNSNMVGPVGFEPTANGL